MGVKPVDSIDKVLINQLQKGFPVCSNPYASVGDALGITETEVIKRIKELLDNKTLSRFGPMYHAEKLGGGLTLAAMEVPEQDFDDITEIVNSFPEIAHNYKRQHRLNMWFVIATETPEGTQDTINRIELKTGLSIVNLPKLEEFHVGLYLPA